MIGNHLDEHNFSEEASKAYNSALCMLAYKPRTRLELEKLLGRKGFASCSIEVCLEKLKCQGLLNDSDYATRFVELHVQQQKGRNLIRQQLLQKGVAHQEVDHVLAHFSYEKERKMALNLILRKWPNFKGSALKRKIKGYQMLLRRGYERSLALTVVQQMMGEQDDPGRD